MNDVSEKNMLVDSLVKKGRLSSDSIINAFRKVDRKDFVREGTSNPYQDYPIPIGKGQTISQPSTVAFMLELLSPDKGDSVLDIGSGSGWTTALLAEMVGEKGNVTGMELRSSLVDFGVGNLGKYNFKNAKILQADKDKLGSPGKTFDKILVSASANTFPEELKDQLKPNGVLVMPVKNSIFKITKIDKDNYKEEEFPGFVFVPLVGKRSN